MKRTCTASGAEFEIDAQAQSFYDKMGVPAPTLCPEERQRRRWAWRGKNFYLRPCHGCRRKVMSWYSPELRGLKTYCEECFRSDSFDARSFGRSFDFTRPFFDQYFELFYDVPKHSSNAMQNENCDYIISAHRNKNCYMTDETDFSRDCYFGYTLQRAENIVEGLYVHDCEIGYQLIKAEHCYNTFYSQNAFHCSDSAFLMNCRSCRHCLYCTNLRNKDYHLFNEPVGKADYERLWRELFNGSRKQRDRLRGEYERFLRRHPVPQSIIINSEDCRGHYVTNSKNVIDCFCVDSCKDCRYCTDIHNSRDVYDVNIYEGELMYECLHVGPESYNNIGCFAVWYSHNVFYSTDAYYLKNCFGCSGLKKEEYCILNQRYSKPEYESLRQRIIEHMRETQEWGEFFPLQFSPQPYNASMAQRFFPLSREQAEHAGMDWLEEPDLIAEPAEESVPDLLDSIGGDFHSKVFRCSQTGRKFRFTEQELAFYQRFGLPLPTESPLARMESLWTQMGPRRLFERSCSSCKKLIHSGYPADYAGEVLCEACYLQRVN